MVVHGVVVYGKIMDSAWCGGARCGGAWSDGVMVHGVVVHGKIMESAWCQARNQGGGGFGGFVRTPFSRTPLPLPKMQTPLKLSNSISGIGFQSCPFLV